MCRCEAVPLLATVGFTGFDDWSFSWHLGARIEERGA